MKTDYVDIFWGTERSIPNRNELASRWFFLKAQAGNLSPGAVLPFSFVSAQPYTGGYPSGSTPYQANTKGIPEEIPGTRNIKGFTHCHQSGTGAIKNYYNYLLVTPGERIDLTQNGGVPITNQSGRPGSYNTELENGVKAKLTVADRVALHRYNVPDSLEGVSVDMAHHGLLTYRPESAGIVEFHVNGPTIEGKVEYEKLTLYFAISSMLPGSWHRRGESRAFWRADRSNVELRIGFSLASSAMAANHIDATIGKSFEQISDTAKNRWEAELAKVDAVGESSDLFYSALYNALKKPVDLCEDDRIPFEQHAYADFATLWDQYKTHLPLLSLLTPNRYSGMMNSLLDVYDKTGAFPGAILMQNSGHENYSNQAKALPHVALAQGYFSGVTGVDYLRAVNAMTGDLRRSENLRAIEHPESVTRMTHLLDLCEGIAHTRRVANNLRTTVKTDIFDPFVDLWRSAYDSTSGILRDKNGDLECEYYEGTSWNYSFRLMHQITERIDMVGRDRFIKLLDHFFGYDRDVVRQPIDPDESTDYSIDYHSFEGLNNEPDMETPYNYHFAGRTDRTFDIIDTIMKCQFQRGPNGVPGNDDSGGLTSWYAWNAIGLFPVSGHNTLLIGTPALDRATFDFGHTFTVSKRNGDGASPYVSKATLNGEVLDRLYITYDELRSGGELVLDMSSDPDQSITGRPPVLAIDEL